MGVAILHRLLALCSNRFMCQVDASLSHTVSTDLSSRFFITIFRNPSLLFSPLPTLLQNVQQLPNPAGKAGGVCTSALLQVWYQNPHSFGKMSWVELLKEMRSTLKEMGFEQVPQLSSSRLINVESEPMHICPPGSGRRRAVLIGINYVGQEGQLTACHDDCRNVAEYLTTVQGFDPNQMLILMDDGEHTAPTKANIVRAFELLALYSQPGDVVFVSFSGHGGRVKDVSGDEVRSIGGTLAYATLVVRVSDFKISFFSSNVAG
jgi:hypothetical protein